MKTNFISNLKHFLFLLVAIFGTFSSPAQSTQTTIGGSKTPDPGGFMDIGGKKPPVGEVICLDFGDTGGGQPTTKPPILFFRNTVCGFASDDDTGGNGGVIIGRPGIGGRQQEPTNPFGSLIVSQSEPPTLFDIGGKDKPEPILFTTNQASLLFAMDTGGRGTGTSSDTGQVNDPNDIGGRSSTGDYAMFDDGMNESFNLNFIYTPEHGCTFDTGGRNGTGTSTGGDYDDNSDDYDTGGGRTSGNSAGELTTLDVLEIPNTD